MKVDKRKLDLALAQRCMNLRGLRAEMSPQTLTAISKGKDVRPATLGKLAKALGVDPKDIIKEEA